MNFRPRCFRRARWTDKMRLTLITYLLLVASVLAVPGFASGRDPVAFEVRLVSGSLKIFPDAPPPGIPGALLKITAARNEYAPFQVAVSALRGEWTFAVTMSKLSGGKGAIDVPVGSMLLVENVLVKKPSIPTADDGKKDLGRFWPDPLPPLALFHLKDRQTRAVWIDLFVPPRAGPGVYRGSVVVSAVAGERIEVPVEIEVRETTLPTAPSIRTAFGNSALPACIEKAHSVVKGGPGYQKLLEDYYWFLVEHRLSPYHIPVEIYNDEAHRFLDDPRVTFFVIPVAPGSSEKKSGIWNDSEMNRLSARLTETGWIEKGAFYVIDEPKEDAFAEVVKIGKRIHSVNPAFRYLMTPDSAKILACREVLQEASVDIWVPMLSVMSRRDERAILLEEQKKGKELWWYTCVVPKWKGMNYFIDEGAVAPRALPWMNHLYGNTGILYWATDNWTRVGCDPWSETETFPTGNGDGCLVYPGRDFQGPIASIRLKMIREGLEDYELLTLLGNRLREVAARIGGRAVHYRPEERLFEHALALITEDGRFSGSKGETPYLMHVTQDYREIEKRRELVIDEAESAFERPLLLVSTSPGDGAVTDGCAAIVRGYAEETTEIQVNGVAAPVRENTFEAPVILVPGINTITVRGTDSYGKAKTVRTVIIRK